MRRLYLGCLVVLTVGVGLVAPATYSKHRNMTSASTGVFEARADSGGYTSFGSSGGGYGAPAALPIGGGGGGHGGGGFVDSHVGGGGGIGAPSGGYGAPAAATFKYQIYPSQSGYGGGGGGYGGGGGGGWGMSGGGGGWGDDDEDGGGGGLDKELLGLLGLFGLKGLKGLKGLIPFIKALFILKKLGLIPLLPILLPILLPLFLLKAALLLLPLLLLLFIPVPVITTGRRILESASTGKGLKAVLQETLDEIMGKIPKDLSHILKNIKNKTDFFPTEVVSNEVNKENSVLPSSDDPLTSSRSSSKKMKPIKFIKPTSSSTKVKGSSE